MAEMMRLEFTDGNELTSEEIAHIREAAKYPIVFSEDCPELTDEQLAQFRPVNFATMEERRRAMIEAGVIDEDEDIKQEIEEPVLAAV